MITREGVKTIEIDLINHCNLSCSICSRQQELGRSLKKGTMLNNQVILNCLQSLPHLTTVDLVGSYSEPTFYPEFLPLIKELKLKGYRLRIATNGNTRNVSFWESFGELLDEKDIIRFGVDGSNQQIHSRYRTGGSLDEVLKNHQVFKKTSNAITVLQNIIFAHNEADVENIKKIFLAEKFDILEFTQTGKPYGNNEGNSFPIAELNERHKELEIHLNKIKLAKFDCQSIKHSQLYLSHTGILLPCDDLEDLILTRYITGEKVMNILENSLEECLDFINSLIRYRALSKECQRACCDEAQRVKLDYPVLQSERDLVIRELKNYRGVISDE